MADYVTYPFLASLSSFSFAADIAAHIRCRAACRPFVNFFSNWIGSLSFYPIFEIYSLNVHNNIAQKPVGLQFDLMLLILLFNLNDSKLGFLEVFDHFLKSFFFQSFEVGTMQLGSQAYQG